MKKLIIFLLCVCIVGTGGFFGYRKYKNSQDEKKVVDVVPVNLMAQTADMFMYTSSEMQGEIVSANSQKVRVDTEKLVKKVFVKEGDEVKKGDTILEYDMTVVELELAQKENQVKVIEQNIKMANKELAEYRNYQPSENAPQPEEPDEPDYPEEPYIPDEPVDPVIPDEPVIPEEPVETVDTVKPAFVPASGTGTKDDPYIINCNEKTKVTKLFMNRIDSTGKYAHLNVYDENSRLMYIWIVGGGSLKDKDLTEWCVSDGVSADKKTGLISVDTSAKHYGLFSVAMPEDYIETDDSSADSMPEDYLPDDYEDPSDHDDFYTDYEDEYDDGTDEQPGNMDYVYSRSEIQKMIADKQSEIKGLEIDLKGAKMEYENAKKQKSDGKVVAAIDGVVKKIGSASGSDTDSDTEGENEGSVEDMEDPGMEFEEDPYGEESSDSDVFALIEGAGGVEVRFMVSELKLPQTAVGETVNVMSWETGASAVAEITGTDSEPYSYDNYNWGENPNNSTYYVHAKLGESTDFSVGDWVSVTLNQTQSQDSDSLYMPIHYVRQEGGDYYIMKAGKDNKLEKAYVKAGQVMYGSFIEITGGLSMSDRICFPYGTDVKEGIKTKDSTEVLYPENYY